MKVMKQTPSQHNDLYVEENIRYPDNNLRRPINLALNYDDADVLQ